MTKLGADRSVRTMHLPLRPTPMLLPVSRMWPQRGLDRFLGGGACPVPRRGVNKAPQVEQGLARCLSCQALPGSPVTRPLACQPEGVARCRREQPVNLCRGTPPRAGSSAGVCRGMLRHHERSHPWSRPRDSPAQRLPLPPSMTHPNWRSTERASHGTLPHRAASRHRLRLGPSCRSPRARRPRRADKPLAVPS